MLVEIRKGMYGLKQAGCIANDRLKQHLKSYGYVPCRYTPGLFTHTSRKISFALCVDDFGVKYTDKADAQHLLTSLENCTSAHLLFNSKISTKGGRFMCINLKDFYPGKPTNWYKYMWIKMSDIPKTSSTNKD